MSDPVNDPNVRVHVMKPDGTTSWLPLLDVKALIQRAEDGLRHLTQPIVLDVNLTPRFKANRLVRLMLDLGRAGQRFDLNTIAAAVSSSDDRYDYAQLMQLIGYSVSGFGDVTGVPKGLVQAADDEAERLMAEAREAREAGKDVDSDE